MSDKHHDPEICGCGSHAEWCPLNPKASELASSTGYPTWSKERRVWQLLKAIEQHCPCGARPESLNTHPHVTACPVSQALELMSDNDRTQPPR